jgi:hypothetical protein
MRLALSCCLRVVLDERRKTQKQCYNAIVIWNEFEQRNRIIVVIVMEGMQNIVIDDDLWWF